MIELVRAGNPGPFTLEGTNSWILEGLAVVDPGPLLPAHVERLVAVAPALRTVLLTHRHQDHAPAALMLKELRAVEIVAPEGALESGLIDRVVFDGDRIRIGEMELTVIATPGHTDEHVCYFSSRGDLFTGDTILGEGTTTIFPPDGKMGAYLDSLHRLRDLRPVRIYPGHGPVREDADALIRYYISHRLEREAQIVSALGPHAVTIVQLREEIYPALHPALHYAAETQLLAHLLHLQERSLVVREGTLWMSNRTDLE